MLYRHFWGLAAIKRAQLIASFPSGAGPTNSEIPEYAQITPTADTRWRLSPSTMEGGYESWPGLDELFPVSYQGVNHNRGLDGGIIGYTRSEVETRLQAYLSAKSFAQAKQECPEIAAERARYDAERAWTNLKAEGHFKSQAVKEILTFPFDQRWIYYVAQDKWLNEARSDLADNIDNNELFLTVPEPRKVSETRPVYSTVLPNLHVHERGSVAFPRETRGDDLLSDRDANIAEPTWRFFSKHFGLKGLRRDADARAFVAKLFRLGFAIMHAPAYQEEHKSALSSDWAHLPIPKNHDVFDQLVEKGELVTRLLNANRDASDTIEAVLSKERAVALGPLVALTNKTCDLPTSRSPYRIGAVRAADGSRGNTRLRNYP